MKILGCYRYLALFRLGDNLGVGDGISLLLEREELALLGHLLHPLALRVLRQAVVGNLGLCMGIMKILGHIYLLHNI